jgi:hypothetical protein
VIENPFNKEKVMHLIGLYFAVLGGTTALLKTGRGLLRGAGRLAAGDTRGAAVQFGAAVVAPLGAAYTELRHFGDEVGGALAGLVSDESEGYEAPATALPKAVKRGRQTAATPATDGLPV